MNIAIAATTHPGHERENNEDAFAICPDLAHPQWTHDTISVNQSLGRFGSLMLVADGIGGCNAGEVASGIAAKIVATTLHPDAVSEIVAADASGEPDTCEACTTLLRKAIEEADKAINQHIINDFHTVGMGTTIVIAWVQPQYTHVAWCGDSRCYLYDASDGLQPLTQDHSYVQQLIDKGEITSEEALTHPDNNIITRALGDVDCPSEPEVITIPTKADSMLILCTDGLCGYVTDETIQQTVRSHAKKVDKCCHALLQLALDTGGHDNIAVAVARLTDNHPNFFQRLLNIKK